MKSLSVEDTIKSKILLKSKQAQRLTREYISHDTHLSEESLGIDPIALCEIIVELEDRYGIRIEEKDLGKDRFWRIDTLAEVIKKKVLDKDESRVDFKVVMENFVFNGLTERLRTPYEVNFEVTFRCNSRCVFCYDSSGKFDTEPDEMSIDEIKNLIDQCVELDVVLMLFGGGEPFLREDFLELFSYTKQKCLSTYIISNGTLITKDVAREYAKYFDPKFDRIQISLDGSRPEIHDRQRGAEGNFAEAVAGIKNLVSTGKIAPIVNTVATKYNYQDIPNILNLILEIGAGTYRVLRLHPLGRARNPDVYEKLKLTEEQGREIYNFLNQKEQELVGQIGVCSDDCVFPANTKEVRERLEPRPNTPPLSYACSAGTTKLTIAPNGDVFPCSYFYNFPELKISSIREKSLKEIWEDEVSWAPYRKKTSVKGKCRICPYLYTCRGGCRVMSYNAHGDMEYPDPGCSYDPAEDYKNNLKKEIPIMKIK